ncbi:MAG: hypothetical protein IPJ13_05425 [Saprospiraceae bacterium]|nr:hypothetical protein [Saprospiraceae bacterium]
MFYSVLLSTFFFFNCASGDRQEEITTKATKPYSFKDQVIVSDDQERPGILWMFTFLKT